MVVIQLLRCLLPRWAVHLQRLHRADSKNSRFSCGEIQIQSV